MLALYNFSFQTLQFLTSPRFDEICKNANLKRVGQDFPYDSLMGILLSCIISSYSHNSCTLLSSECEDAFMPNILQIREQFCFQIQELLGSLFRSRNCGNSEETSNYWLYSDSWKEYLKYFEKYMLELMRRHMSNIRDFDTSYVSQERRSSSPVAFESNSKMR